MDVKEHFYRDDPARGPADVRTTLPGVDYFFLGNGLIQAAVQVCRASKKERSPKGWGTRPSKLGAVQEGGTKVHVPGRPTPVGLLVMDPDVLGPKRDALSFDGRSGLEATLISITAGGKTYRPRSPRARWIEAAAVPTVEATWNEGPFRVRERFYCPSLLVPSLVRTVRVAYSGSRTTTALFRTGVKGKTVRISRRLSPGAETDITLEYGLDRRSGGGARVSLAPVRRLVFLSRGALNYWTTTAVCRLPDPLLLRYFSAAKSQLSAAVSCSGRLDGGIWQYNLEWVRDQAFIAMALAMSGQFEPARTILDRLLREFIAADGAPLDSSRHRPWQESELDQNGVLLMALESYVDWTGDTTLLEAHRDKIIKTAAYTLQTRFRHSESGLLRNRREFWERHGAHGIEDGMELAHELFVSLGLDSAARLAARMGVPRRARTWREASARLKDAMLNDRTYGLVAGGRFIKRRGIDGRVQNRIEPAEGQRFPDSTPLFGQGPHFIDPDSSAALPIAWGLVDPKSALSRRTLESLEKLWFPKGAGPEAGSGLRWTGGGYGRYHVTSEPDSPGPWPFASLFIARAWFEAGNDRKVRRVLDWLGTLSGANAASWFEFYGPRPVPPYPQVGIVPWVWAEIVFLFIHHMLGVRPAESSLTVRPRLLAGLDKVEASLRVRGGRLRLTLRKARRGEKPKFTVDGSDRPFRPKKLVLPFPKDFKTVEISGVLP